MQLVLNDSLRQHQKHIVYIVDRSVPKMLAVIIESWDGEDHYLLFVLKGSMKLRGLNLKIITTSDWESQSIIFQLFTYL